MYLLLGMQVDLSANHLIYRSEANSLEHVTFVTISFQPFLYTKHLNKLGKVHHCASTYLNK